MASLLLVVSLVLKRQNVDMEFSNTMPLSCCGATTATGTPCFKQKMDGTEQLPSTTPPAQWEENFEEHVPILKICVESVDLSWP